MSVKKYPSINGLRAISILMVIAFHLTAMEYFEQPFTQMVWLEPFTKIFHNGYFGVNVFFVISGFLITTLLMKEEIQSGTISLKKFFIRRTLRIFPAYYFLLLVYAVLQFCAIIYINWGSWATAVTYMKYFNWKKDWFTSHAWSLSIEEHFYLFWPFLFMQGQKIRRNATVIMMVLAPLLLLLMQILSIGWLNDQIIFTRIDAIATGCYFAIYQDVIIEKLSKYWTLCFYASLIVLFALPNLWELSTDSNSEVFKIAFGTLKGPLGNFAIGTLMMYSVFGPQRLWFKFLNLRIMNFIGLISYSLYLWQQLFINKTELWFNQFPVNIFLILVIATFSYYIIERPFLQLKKKFVSIK
jgi:peptidoglycan/LPS O-acetylase OafA/YrhL